MLLDRIRAALVAATKGRRAGEKNVLRWVLAECKNVQIDRGRGLTDAEVEGVIKRGVKLRREALELYRQGERADLAAAESLEIELLVGYLPEPLSGARLAQVVAETVASVGATSMRDMGAVMKAIMQAHGSEVDGGEVQALVRAHLSRAESPE